MDIVRKHRDLECFPVRLLESQCAGSIRWHAGGAQQVVNDQVGSWCGLGFGLIPIDAAAAHHVVRPLRRRGFECR